MLKYILTSECSKDCPYCITRNVKVKECSSMRKVEKLFKDLHKTHKAIMFTGGEPTESKYFLQKVNIASQYFFETYLTSSSEKVIVRPHFKDVFNAITFSIHDVNKAKQFRVENKAIVYASIMADQYHYRLPFILKENGFAGLTVNEDHRKEYEYTDPDFILQAALPIIPNFSMKINRKGTCINGETIILPDLHVVTSFEEYL